VNYNDFDTTLLYNIIRNVVPPTSIPPPTNGWGHLPHPGHHRLADDVERLREARNVLFAHVTTASITNADFQHHWMDLEGAISRLDTALGTQFKLDVSRLKTTSMDPSMQRHYLAEVQKLHISDRHTAAELRLAEGTYTHARLHILMHALMHARTAYN
jgi:hypothetical protein